MKVLNVLVHRFIGMLDKVLLPFVMCKRTNGAEGDEENKKGGK